MTKEEKIQSMLRARELGKGKELPNPLEGFTVEKSKLQTSLSGYEKETIIVYNQEESTAKICTYQISLRNKILRMARKRSDLVKVVKLTDDGYADFTVPKKWVKVNGGVDISEAE